MNARARPLANTAAAAGSSSTIRILTRTCRDEQCLGVVRAVRVGRVEHVGGGRGLGRAVRLRHPIDRDALSLRVVVADVADVETRSSRAAPGRQRFPVLNPRIGYLQPTHGDTLLAQRHQDRLPGVVVCPHAAGVAAAHGYACLPAAQERESAAHPDGSLAYAAPWCWPHQGARIGIAVRQREGHMRGRQGSFRVSVHLRAWRQP